MRLSRLFIPATVGMLSALAQQPSAPLNKSPFPTGSVIGTVSDGDTKLPLHFAEISLVPQSVNTDSNAGIVPPTAPLGTVAKEDTQPQLVSGFSGFDGSLRLDGIPVGDYFVSAFSPGYVTPGASTPADASEDQLRAVFVSLPTVHISPEKAASINLFLHRGAVIAGRVSFADGGPAVAAQLTWEPPGRPDLRNKVVSARLDAIWRLTGFGNPRPALLADDEGRYRIFGLPPGKYVVSTLLGLKQNSAVRIMFNGGNTSVSGGREHVSAELIPIFAPGTFRRKEARIFEIHGQEQITGADLKIDTKGVHTLKGRVLAGQDRRAPNGAMVQLREKDANDVPRFAEIEDDGSFQFHYLLPATYAMEILANDLAPPDENKQPRQYKTVSLTVVMGENDLALDEVLMTVLQPGEKHADPQF